MHISRIAAEAELQDGLNILRHLFWDRTVSLSLKTNNDTQHANIHTPHHATQHAGSRKLTSTHTHGHNSENQAMCHLRFAYLEEHAYTTHTGTPSLIHCFELWHVLAVTLTSSISQPDSGRDSLVCTILCRWEWEGEKETSERWHQEKRGGKKKWLPVLI